MTIRWFRGATGKVPSLPKNRKPQKPKGKTIPKPKQLMKPKAPGVKLPSVKMPFVHGENCSCCMDKMAKGNPGMDYSAQGIESVISMAQRKSLKVVKIEWIRAGNGEKGFKRCPELIQHPGVRTVETAQPVCPYFASKSWNSFSDMVWESTRYERDQQGHAGIWALSHVGCMCELKVTLASADPSKPLSFTCRISSKSPVGQGIEQSYGLAIEGTSDQQEAIRAMLAVKAEHDAYIKDIISDDKERRALASRNLPFSQMVAMVSSGPSQKELLESWQTGKAPESVLPRLQKLESGEVDIPEAAAPAPMVPSTSPDSIFNEAPPAPADKSLDWLDELIYEAEPVAPEAPEEKKPEEKTKSKPVPPEEEEEEGEPK